MKTYVKAYEAITPLKLPPVTDLAGQLQRLELSSVCFERECQRVGTKQFKKNSYAVRKFAPSIRQGKVWREMGGNTIILSGSTERTHGKRVRHDGRVEARKIIVSHEEYGRLIGRVK